MPEVSIAVMRAMSFLHLRFVRGCDVCELRFGIPSSDVLGAVPVKRDDIDEKDLQALIMRQGIDIARCSANR
jgi:hypothetical protein